MRDFTFKARRRQINPKTKVERFLFLDLRLEAWPVDPVLKMQCVQHLVDEKKLKISLWFNYKFNLAWNSYTR